MSMAKQSRHGAETTAIPILLTRPLAQSRRFGAALEARFGSKVRPVLTPLMQTVFDAAAIPSKDYSAIVFTSEAAVGALRRMQVVGPGLPATAFCVGARTAKAAAAAGFDARSAEGDVEALLNLLRARKEPGPLLYLHGRDTTGDLAARLRSAGIETFSAQIYHQDPLPFAPDAQALLGSPSPLIVPLFSPRSAVLFAQALPGPAPAGLWVAAMSEAVAHAALPLCPPKIEIALQPHSDAMLEAINLLLIGLRGS